LLLFKIRLTCDGDVEKVPVSPFDNALAVDQMEVAYTSLLARMPATIKKGVPAHIGRVLAKDGSIRPKIITYV
jgi:agmatinase